MQCELSKCKFICIVCYTFALITCAYLENVPFVQEQKPLPLTERNKHTDRLNVQEQGKHDCMLSEIGFF